MHVVLWQGYLSDEEPESLTFSLPQLIYEDADRWKALYLDWLGNIANAPAHNGNLEHSLTIRPGLSYWWMTLPTESSFAEDALVFRTLRLWAFVELAEKLGFMEIELVGADPEIARILQEWGRETGRRITSARAQGKPSRGLPRLGQLAKSGSVLLQLPAAAAIIALEFLRYGLKSRTATQRTAHEPHEVTIIDYFDNFQIDQARSSRYRSNYWGRLPEQFALLGIPVHWVHIDCRSTSAPSIDSARKAIEALNENHTAQRHSLLQDRMTLRVLAKVVNQYLAIIRLGVGIRRTRLTWTHAPSRLDMWPLVRRKWRRAYYGVDAARNASWLVLFKGVSEGQQASGSCLYLMENQPWELALISNWQGTNSGLVLGIPHSTVRGWDLRYAIGCAHNQASPFEALPRPNTVLVNGPAASEVLARNGYPVHQLESVEALRYLQTTTTTARLKLRNEFNRLELLALGEYDPCLAARQVDLLNNLVEACDQDLRVTYRPHPSSVSLLAALDGRIRLSSSSEISLDLAESDLAFCSSVSSAAVDALLAGVPVLVFRDGSVLDGQVSGVQVFGSVTNAGELINAVHSFISNDSVKQSQGESCFLLDAELPKWTRLLSSLA